MEKKYYYITYEYGSGYIKTYNMLIDIHPLEWQLQNKNKGFFELNYRLISWQEIDFDTYNKYYEAVNKS